MWAIVNIVTDNTQCIQCTKYLNDYLDFCDGDLLDLDPLLPHWNILKNQLKNIKSYFIPNLNEIK